MFTCEGEETSGTISAIIISGDMAGGAARFHICCHYTLIPIGGAPASVK